MSNPSKKKGTAFESAVVKFLQQHLSPNIERRAIGSIKDRGDITGVFAGGRRVVVECKACTRYKVPEWLHQAEVERDNDDADIGVVIAKRVGIGDKRTGEQLVMMTLAEFVKLIGDTK